MKIQNWISFFVIGVNYIAFVSVSGQCVGSFNGKQTVEIDNHNESSSDSDDASESSTEDCNKQAYEIVKPSNINDEIFQDPAACQKDKMLQCDPNSPYRTINGSCNNLNHPTWGMTTDCFFRFQPTFYTGYESVRESTTGGPLPNPRDLTLKIFRNDERPSHNLTLMFTIYGQMVAHDLSHVTYLPVPGSDCCLPQNVNHPNCARVSISPDDPFYSRFNITCMDVKRTIFCKACNTTHREQMNTVTGILDSSTVYGPTDEKATIMRRYDGTGKLNSSETENGELLPTGKDPGDIFCYPEIEPDCFLAGDPRVNIHATLSSMHTLFLREHNRIAKELKEINPPWGDEKLYQEARKINNAQYQCVTYKEYLPALLGPSIVHQFNLSVNNGVEGTKYSPEIRLGVSNEFAASVFRLHNMVSSKVGALNLEFRNLYSNPELIRQGHMTDIVKGICKVPSDKYGHLYSEDITDYFKQRPINPYGKDLAAVDVQRAREHGLAPYIYLVSFCSGGKINITSFDDLTPRLMSKHHVKLLKKNYAMVEDVDLWAGIQMEHHLPDSELGPTTACIIAKQFYVSKFADRFYFEHDDQTPSFTKDQIQSLKQCSLSRLLCDNTFVKKIQKNAMLLPNHENLKVPCGEIPRVDLSPWKMDSA